MAHNIQSMEIISAEIKQFLKEKRTDAEITDYINNLEPKAVKPTLKLHQLNPEAITEPTLVYAHLMVQDIRDVYYYISFAIRKNYSPNEEEPFYLYKYGINCNNEPMNIQDNKEYIHVMTDRYPVICTPIRYQSKWANQLQGTINPQTEYVLEVDVRADYKLGEIINIVAIYEPELKKLFFVRNASKEEIGEVGLEVLSELANSQVDFAKARHQLMHYLCQNMSESYAEYLITTLISEQPVFLGCESNISQLVSQIYPRVAHIKIVHPCNTSLFPYKNEEGELQMTPMQLSSLPTFVIFDLSEFSTKDKVLIKDAEIENFSAIKMFVEESKTIYRWEIGESHVEHQHKGLIVKAAQLIKPHYNPKDQKIAPELIKPSDFSEESKTLIRKYLQAVMKLDPKLDEDQRKLIEKELSKEEFKQKIGTNLADIMKMSKLLARSHGRTFITLEDFHRGKQLIDLNVTSN